MSEGRPVFTDAQLLGRYATLWEVTDPLAVAALDRDNDLVTGDDDESGKWVVDGLTSFGRRMLACRYVLITATFEGEGVDPDAPTFDHTYVDGCETVGEIADVVFSYLRETVVAPYRFWLVDLDAKESVPVQTCEDVWVEIAGSANRLLIQDGDLQDGELAVEDLARKLGVGE